MCGVQSPRASLPPPVAHGSVRVARAHQPTSQVRARRNLMIAPRTGNVGAVRLAKNGASM